MYSDESDADDGQDGLVDDFNFGEGDDGSSSESEGQDPWEGNQILVDYDDKFTDDSSEIFYYNDPEIDSIGDELSMGDAAEESVHEIGGGSEVGDDMHMFFLFAKKVESVDLFSVLKSGSYEYVSVLESKHPTSCKHRIFREKKMTAILDMSIFKRTLTSHKCTMVQTSTRITKRVETIYKIRARTTKRVFFG